ncbi:MAG: hypothetical protein WC325_09745 [Candidatus Bathyarchaeia archaeon]|jgi:hypothetical protein
MLAGTSQYWKAFYQAQMCPTIWVKEWNRVTVAKFVIIKIGEACSIGKDIDKATRNLIPRQNPTPHNQPSQAN